MSISLAFSTTLMLLIGVSLSSQSSYDTNYGFGGNYGVSSFGGIGSFGFGGSAIGGHIKVKPRKIIFKPRKIRHYHSFKHKMLKPRPKKIEKWKKPNYAIKPVEVWPQAMIDDTYLTPVPLQQVPLQLYPTLEDILLLSNPPQAPVVPAPPSLQVIPAPPPLPVIPVQTPPPSPPPAELPANFDEIVKLITAQLSMNRLPVKPSYSSWLSPDFESNSIAQAVEAKGIEKTQETSTSPIFDLDKLLLRAA
ncbi:hypothetical protein ACFFRR_001816 [Megaselia abdita]